MKEKIKTEIDFLKKDNDKNFSLALLFCTLILFVYCYFGSASFFEKTFNFIENVGFWKIIYHNFMSFLLFFVFGTIFVRFVLKQKNSEMGIKKFKLKPWGIVCLVAIIPAILCGVFSSFDLQMLQTYPLINFNIYFEPWQIILYYTSYICYYIGWEFLFRGILYFSSEKKCGVLGAILITTLISALIHTSIAGFGKPMLETLSAIPAGFIFGYVASKSRSIYPSLIIHFLIGLSTDLCIFLLA